MSNNSQSNMHMNTLTKPPKITIDIVSDFVCPWCFIGQRNLSTALSKFKTESDLPLAVRWLPFFLNPDTPPEGEPYRPFLERKFGGAATLEAAWTHVCKAGEAAGITFAFEKIELRANTLAAHRLIHRAQALGGDANKLIAEIFYASFCEGRAIGDPAVLAEMAANCQQFPGETQDETLVWLHSPAEAAAVVDEEAHIRQISINGVPLFIFNNRLAVTGAQPPEVLLDALRESITNS